jgi:hypothetical protein
MSDYKGGFLDGAHAEKLAQQTRITELEAQQAAAPKDAARLDFMIEHSAFMVRHHSNRWQCQMQDLDENYIVLSGIGCSYLTEREAIDAAIAGEQAWVKQS